MLKIKTICHDWDLWKVAQSCKHLHLICLPDTWNFQLPPYSVDIKDPGVFWNPLSKLVLNWFSFICNKGSVNNLHDHKAQKELVCQACKYFSYFRQWYPLTLFWSMITLCDEIKTYIMFWCNIIILSSLIIGVELLCNGTVFKIH